MEARRTRTDRHAIPAPAQAATPEVQCSRRGSLCTPFPGTTEGIVIRQQRPANPRAHSEACSRREPGFDSDAPVVDPDMKPERRVVLTAPGVASLHGRRPLRTPAIALLGRVAPILAAALLAVGAPDRSALAQSEPTLTIAANSTTHGYQINNVVFTVTRTGTIDSEISGSLTLTQDQTFLPAGSLSWTFTIPQNQTTATHTIGWERFTGGATLSGDLTATIDAGNGYTVGMPGAATVEMVVLDPAITVRPEHAAYSFDEDDASASVVLVARTAPDLPKPNADIFVSLSSKGRTVGAQSPDDYEVFSKTIVFEPADFVESDDEWEARKEFALSIVDDGETEGDETFDLKLQNAPSQTSRIGIRQANGTVCPAEGCLTPVTILDNDTLTIAASQQSYAFGVDNVEFTVTRNGTAEEEISGTLTLAQDEAFLDTNFLRLDFTIAADETSTDMMAADEKSTNIVLSAALFDGDATQSGDLTATIEAGDGYTVGTPGTATVRMVVADSAIDSSITVRPEHATYSFDEDDAAASVTFVAGTAPGAPPPDAGFSVTVSAKARSDGAGSPDDYASLSEIIRFDPADFDESGDEWEARKEVALSIVDDGEDEDDETFDLKLEGAPGLSARIKLRQADGTVCPDEGCLTPVTIVDNEVPAVVATHDTATTPVDTAVEVPVLENDTYVGRNGHLLGVSRVTGSVYGTTRINEDRTGVVFVPETGYSGIARFTYTVSDDTLTDTAAVIVAVGGDSGAGVGVPVWQARWSSTGSGGCTTLSLGVENTNPEAPVAEGEWIGVTLHVDRQRSTVDVDAIEVKDASGTVRERGFFFPSIHHEGSWVYAVGTPAVEASTAMTVELAGTGESPCDGTLVAWVYVNGWLAGRDQLTVEPELQMQRLASSSPVLRISDARGREGVDAALVFDVTLEGTANGKVTVDYATSDGTAVAGEDYTAVADRLTFAPGERKKTLVVALLDDATDEGEETFAVTLSNPPAARVARARATGIIENTDAMPKAWLARFGRTVAAQVVDAVSERIAAPSASHVRVGGVELRHRESGDAAADLARHMQADPAGDGWEPGSGRAFSPTLREILSGTSFHLRSGEAGVAPVFAAWGRFALGRFDAEVDGTRLDGSVDTGIVGADAEWEDVLAGVAFSYSEGDGAFRLVSGMPSNRGRGTVESTLTSVYPYVRFRAAERTSVWAMGGVGAGELTLVERGVHPIRTDIRMRMGAVGARRTLVPAPDDGGIGLSLKSDAFWVRTTSDAVLAGTHGNLAASEADANRVRLVVAGERVFALTDGGSFTPSVEVGARYDGGDAETGAGLEVGFGLRWTVEGMSIEGSLRTLVAHEDDGHEEWGGSGSIRIDPGAAGRGLSLTVAPSFGAASGGVERLWSLGDARGFAPDGGYDAGNRIEAELGYGLRPPVGPGVMTPYTGITVAEGGARAMRLGARWPVAPSIALAVEAARIERLHAEPEPALRLRASARW